MKTNLSAPDIQALVERMVGPVSQLEPLPEGLVSQVYGFCRGQARYVVRVAPTREGFDKDAFAWRHFSSADLPIPEVFTVDSFGDISACISRRAGGVRVRDVSGDLAALSLAILEVLTAVGEADISATTGFGVFDAHGQARHPSWRGYLLAVFDEDFCNWGLIGDRAQRRLVEQAILEVERLAPAKPHDRGLIHGDFGAANLMSDGRLVTAVLDWDRALIGDAAYDQASLFFWGEPHLAAVRPSLASRHRGDEDWARRMLCYQLRICLQELSENLAGLTPGDADWLLARCADLVGQARRLA